MAAPSLEFDSFVLMLGLVEEVSTWTANHKSFIHENRRKILAKDYWHQIAKNLKFKRRKIIKTCKFIRNFWKLLIETKRNKFAVAMVDYRKWNNIEVREIMVAASELLMLQSKFSNRYPMMKMTPIQTLIRHHFSDGDTKRASNGWRRWNAKKKSLKRSDNQFRRG